MNNLPGIEARLFSPDYIPPPENTILTISGKNIGNLESYVVYSGLPKSGKSTFIAGLIASAFTSWGAIFGQKINLPADRPRLALFDTESSGYDLHRQRERIKHYIGRPDQPTNLHIFSMREDLPVIIREFIEQYIKDNPDCSVIVIDGLLDLCLNYNDEAETRYLTNWLKRITKVYNLCVIVILHLAKNGLETIGHLGSNTDRWAQSTLTVRNDKQTKQLVLEAKFLRSSDHFEPIAITWSEQYKQFILTDYMTPPEPEKRPPGRPKKTK